MKTKQTTNKTILFTGGGSSGHVTPNIALINKFLIDGWTVEYIGSKTGIEKTLIQQLHIPYYVVASGKLRRYFSWQNFIDPFKIILGILQSFFLCRQLKPKALFSKGGFVAFPVAVGAWLNRIPIYAHESDMTPGLANKLTLPLVKQLFTTFPETKNHVKSSLQVTFSGALLRNELFNGDPEKARRLCQFNNNKKVILVMGGGLGAKAINVVIHQNLNAFTQHYNIIHICGKGKTELHLNNKENYKQFEYLHDEFFDMLHYADAVVSRAGSNTIFELLALKKFHILIPLSSGSRGEQISNARYFEKKGLSKVIEEKQLTYDLLLATINDLIANQNSYQQKLANFFCPIATEVIYQQMTLETKADG